VEEVLAAAGELAEQAEHADEVGPAPGPPEPDAPPGGAPKGNGSAALDDDTVEVRS
jgi:hypothetical protein